MWTLIIAGAIAAAPPLAKVCPRTLPPVARLSKEPCHSCGDYKRYQMPIARDAVTFWYWADFTRTHRAKDLGARIGTAVVYNPAIFCYAIAKTTVVYARDVARERPLPVDPAVVLKHTTKSRQTFFTFYAHLSKVAVKEGETIAPGTVLGEVGDVGAIKFFRTIRGIVNAGDKIPHLHFGVTAKGEKGEVLVDGGRHFIDPRRVLRLRDPPGKKR